MRYHRDIKGISEGENSETVFPHETLCSHEDFKKASEAKGKPITVAYIHKKGINKSTYGLMLGPQ